MRLVVVAPAHGGGVGGGLCCWCWCWCSINGNALLADLAALLGVGDDESVAALLPLVEDVHLACVLVPEGVEVVVHVLELLQRLVHAQRRHLEHLGAHHLGEHRVLVLGAHGLGQVLFLLVVLVVGNNGKAPVVGVLESAVALHLRLLLLDLAELALDDGGGHVDAGVGGVGVLLGAEDAVALAEERDLAAGGLGAPAQVAAAGRQPDVHLADQVAVLRHRPPDLVLDVLLHLLRHLQRHCLFIYLFICT
ncbi:uncharacterized protein LOC120648928 [Panicum virgatum]|uniref:uncharacterized protein LOC120648928 n=1 Tax=Panicum virgatum TaxID=38727 RepID=UPI0019D55E15|nr:uncharacterized protein LOC120648928 [Panicum virgatum]